MKNDLIRSHLEVSVWRPRTVASFLIVRGRRGVLSGSLRVAAVDFRELFDRNLLVRDLLPDRATDDRRHFWKVKLNRTEKRISLTDVRGRVLEYCDNNASLVLGCDWRVPPCGSERRENFTLADHWREVEQPFGEERRPEVDRRYSGPVEYTLA